MKDVKFNEDWLFKLEDAASNNGTNIEESTWEVVQLPHDWSMEIGYDQKDGEGCTGYMLGGIGWYRKWFEISEEALDRVTTLVFDGVYNYCQIYVNGILAESHEYGYAPFSINISPYLRKGDNLIAVRVDHTRYADSRWYTGSGIYRSVNLVSTPKIHIPVWGTYVTTPIITPEKSRADIQITLENKTSNVSDVQVKTTLFFGDEVIKSQMSELITLEPGIIDYHQIIQVDKAKLWHVDEPNMYKALTDLVSDGETIQSYETSFGFRTIKFDCDTGFYLNGESMKIKGVCLHHDGGLVGAAVPDGVWLRRLKRLKEGGCNAIRTAHNPFSQGFMDLCDGLGLMVQVEFYDEWDNAKDKRMNMKDQNEDYITRSNPRPFREWAEIELKNTMLRDRNHPCVIQWSIGNEIEWTYPKSVEATGYFGANANGNYFWEKPPYSRDQIKATYESLPMETYEIGETASLLAQWTREMDLTRPVIANCILPSSSYETGYAQALDIIGYSYRQVMYDYGHEHYPNQPIMGTENLGQWHEWQHVMDRPFISGMFIWTGIDYIGESRSGWPIKGNGSGMLDYAGFPKPSYHMMKTLWRDEPHIHIVTSALSKSIYCLDENNLVTEKVAGAWKQRLWTWHEVNSHWNYREGESTIVECYSNCDMAELFVNDISYGSQKLMDQEDKVFKWFVPYIEGTIKVVGHKSRESLVASITSAGEAYGIVLNSDDQDLKVQPDGIVHIVAQLVDEKGIAVKHQDQILTFKADGPFRLIGVDNGASDNVANHKSYEIMTSQGKALIILQLKDLKGEVMLHCSGKGLKSEILLVDSADKS